MKLLTKVADMEVVASGSNANGEWVKFGNGTLLQYGVYDTGSSDFRTPYGAIWFDNKNHWITLPISFYNTEYCVSLTMQSAGGIGSSCLSAPPIVSAFRCYVFSTLSYNFTSTVKIYWKAIGRWK